MSKKNKQDKQKRKSEPPVIPYKGFFICRINHYYRIKLNPTDHYAVHHGSFDSVQEAKEYIDKSDDETVSD